MADSKTDEKNEPLLHDEVFPTSTPSDSDSQDYAPSFPEISIQSKQLVRQTVPCRYHRAGYCRHGSFCHFKHTSGKGVDNSPNQFNEGAIPSDIPPCSPSAPCQASPTWFSTEHQLSPTLHFANTSPASYVYYAVLKSPGSDAYTFVDAPSPSLDETLTSPSYMRQEFPDNFNTTLLSGHVIPHFVDPAMNPHIFYNNYAAQGPQQVAANPKKKGYKAKVRRFYKHNRKSSKGDGSPLIHKPTVTDKQDRKDVKLSMPTPESKTHRQTNPPEKPLSVYDGRRGSSPITWRVIGGGVMMGGQREPCKAYAAGFCDDGDDCRYSHIDENTESLDPFRSHDICAADPIDPSCRQIAMGRSAGSRSPSRTSDKQIECIDPSTLRVCIHSMRGRNEDSASILVSRRRSHSESLPTSPVTNHNPFAAEL